MRDTRAGYLAAVVAVAGATAGIGLLLATAQIANVSALYLLAVLAVGARWGRGPAVLASLLSFLAFDWFFVNPVYTLTVSDPEEWLALLLLLVASFVTGGLTARLRQQAEEAQQRAGEALQLYAVGRRLAVASTLDAALQSVVEYLHAELDLATCAVLLVADDRSLRVAASTGAAGAASTVKQPHWLLAGTAPDERAQPRRWVRVHAPAPAGTRPAADALHRLDLPLQADGPARGSLRVQTAAHRPPFNPAENRLLEAAADQIALAVERAQLQAEANAAEVLRRTDELRAALLSSVSHDLRTPLASIKAAAGSLRQRDVQWSEAERAGFAAAIENEADRLDRLVGNLLDMSRIEAGALQPEKDWYPLAALVDDVLARLHDLAADHPLTSDVPDTLPPLLLDYVEIDQVLTNLLENAGKYTPPGTPIAVRARTVDGAVEVAVQDAGPGIPPAALPYLFDKFYRVRAAAGGPRGTGLGLAVAKGLVEAHGGRLWVDSTVGQGTTFRFTLPLTAPESVGAPAAVGAGAEDAP